MRKNNRKCINKETKKKRNKYSFKFRQAFSIELKKTKENGVNLVRCDGNMWLPIVVNKWKWWSGEVVAAVVFGKYSVADLMSLAE